MSERPNLSPDSAEQETATTEESGRLDQFLVRQWPVLDRRLIRTIVQAGDVLINGEEARKPGQYLDAGDVVAVTLPEPPEPEPLSPVAVRPIDVLYQDEALLVVDKPANVGLRPTRAYPQHTVAQQLGALYPAMAHVGAADRAGIVMHLEPEISGPVLAARDEETYRALRRLTKRQQVEQVYSALVEGRFSGEYLIDQPIGNSKHVRRKLAVAREGRPARTFCRFQRHYKSSGQDYSLLEVRPETARLHQIRVHLSWFGFPLVGDTVYGSREQPLLRDRIFLHLSVLSFSHPLTGETLAIESLLPPALSSILQYMRRPKR